MCCVFVSLLRFAVLYVSVVVMCWCWFGVVFVVLWCGWVVRCIVLKRVVVALWCAVVASVC